MSNELKGNKKYGFAAFIPMFVFLGLYLGCGLYYTITGTVEQPWNQFPRHAAILVGIVAAFLMCRAMPLPEKVKHFCKAAGDEGTIMMCMIFLVAGAFSGVCKAMGGLSQILCKHRNAVQIEQNIFKAEVAQAAAALFSK